MNDGSALQGVFLGETGTLPLGGTDREGLITFPKAKSLLPQINVSPRREIPTCL